MVPVARIVYRGIPQGSVVGPHLWNLGYNAVLREVLLPPGCNVVCYTDDHRGWERLGGSEKPGQRGHSIVRHITDFDLELVLTPQKMETI